MSFVETLRVAAERRRAQRLRTVADKCNFDSGQLVRKSVRTVMGDSGRFRLSHWITVIDNRLDRPLATTSTNDLKHCGAMPHDDPKVKCTLCVIPRGVKHPTHQALKPAQKVVTTFSFAKRESRDLFQAQFSNASSDGPAGSLLQQNS